MKSIRQIAAEALLELQNKNAWSNLTLNQKICQYKLEGRDIAFFSMLFYGVLERLITLDACIAAHSKTPVKKLSKEVLVSLRTGIYQLLYMNSVPDHAAVAESVELVKKLRKAQAAGFVNGVMRSFLRGEKKIPVPKGPLQKRLSVEYACPEEIVELWLESYGEDFTKKTLGQSLGRPPVYIRANTLRVSMDKLASLLSSRGVTAVPDGELENCLAIEKFGAVYDLPEFQSGLFHVQDKSSQICALSLNAAGCTRVLDACAAPGGKSFTVAQIMGGKGEIVSCDVHPARVGLISKRADEMGLWNISARVADSAVFDEKLGLFDRVLCDVPCSGLGVIRRKPEIKMKGVSEFASLPDLQYNILENTSRYVKPGGRIVYSTCTLNPNENELVAERFAVNHPLFLKSGEFVTTPLENGSDGFFIAAFTRRGE